MCVHDAAVAELCYWKISCTGSRGGRGGAVKEGSVRTSTPEGPQDEITMTWLHLYTRVSRGPDSPTSPLPKPSVFSILVTVWLPSFSPLYLFMEFCGCG